MLVLSTISAKAQVNYVQNPSFELYDTCPDWIGQINRATHWNSTVGNSANFFHACANPSIYTGVPINENGGGNGLSHQYPRNGIGHINILLNEETNVLPSYFNGEYVRNLLKSKLTKDKSYCVKAYLSVCEGGINCFTDGFGFYFDDGTYTSSMNVNPQVENPVFNYLTDSVGWMEVSGTFIASGDEEYLNLGNFRKLQSNFIPTANDPNNGYYFSAYYLDDVSVIESDLPAFAGNDTSLQNIGDSVYLGRQPEIGLECTWYNSQGDIIGTGAGLWVQPQHTSFYVVEQNLCGNIKRDTVYISMGTSVENGSIWEGVKVFPNPSEGRFRLQFPTLESREWLISLCEVSGKEVYKSQLFCQGEIEIATHLPSGMYFLHIQDRETRASIVRRVVIK